MLSFQRERCLFIFLLIFLLPFAAKANENLSLDEALKIAKGQNPEIILQRYEVYKAEANKLTAKQWTNPTFEVLFGGLPHSENNSTSFCYVRILIVWDFEGFDQCSPSEKTAFLLHFHIIVKCEGLAQGPVFVR